MVDRLARVVRLEHRRPLFPWNLPFAAWPDDAVAGVGESHVLENLTDTQLRHIVADQENDSCTD
jgi:hypothetical protein